MAFTFGFYNSEDHDRVYNADQFNDMFEGLITDGVYSTIDEAMMVTPGGGLSVNVGSGRAWFNSTWTKNTSKVNLTLDPPDLLLPRIDAVVLEVNKTRSVRANSFKIIKGTPATRPARPNLSAENDVFQHILAYITVNQNVDIIKNSDIENKIGVEPGTPFVTGILKSVDITDLFTQWQGQFDDWFLNVQGTLDGDTAGALLNQINQRVKISDKATYNDAKAGIDDTKWMSPKNVSDAINANRTKDGEVIFSGPPNISVGMDHPYEECPNYGGDGGTSLPRIETVKRLSYKYGAVGVDPYAYIGPVYRYCGKPMLYNLMTSTFTKTSMTIGEYSIGYQSDRWTVTGPNSKTYSATSPVARRLLGFVKRTNTLYYAVLCSQTKVYVIRIYDIYQSLAEGITVTECPNVTISMPTLGDNTYPGIICGDYWFLVTAASGITINGLVWGRLSDPTVTGNLQNIPFGNNVTNFLSRKMLTTKGSSDYPILTSTYGNILYFHASKSMSAYTSNMAYTLGEVLYVDGDELKWGMRNIIIKTPLSYPKEFLAALTVGFYDDNRFWELIVSATVTSVDYGLTASVGYDNEPGLAGGTTFFYSNAFKTTGTVFAGGHYDGDGVYLYPIRKIKDRSGLVTGTYGDNRKNNATGIIDNGEVLAYSQYNMAGSYPYSDSSPVDTTKKNWVLRFDESLGLRVGVTIKTHPTYSGITSGINTNATEIDVSETDYVKVYPGAYPLVSGLNDACIYLP